MKQFPLFFRTISIVLLLLLLTPSAVGCTVGDSPAETTIEASETTATVKTPVPAEDSLDHHYYLLLSDTEKQLYNSLLPTLQNGDLAVVLKKADYDSIAASINRVAAALYYEHPEAFHIRNAHEVSGEIYPGENDDTVTVSWQACEFESSSDVTTMRSALNEKVAEIVSSAKQYEPPYEQAKFVHDYIIAHTVYDEANANLRNAELNSAYSCLVEGKAVCGGYARAFQLLMNHLGIPCTTLSGQADGGPHAWNAITLNGENYLIDLTWDDSENGISYAYFGLTTEELFKTHAPDTTFPHPICTANTYNYYRHEGLLLDQYDFDAVYAVFEKQKNRARGYVKFATQDTLDEAIEDLIDDQNWTKLPGFEDAGSIQYMIDPRNLILYIDFPQ